MYYCLIYHPNSWVGLFQEIRRKYDPTFKLVGPHVTVVFPVPDAVDESGLISHIDDVLTERSPFKIRFGGLCKSADHWLLLQVAEGRSKFVELHSALYTGILSEYLRSDVEYAPHLGLGLFLKEGARYNWDSPQDTDFDQVGYDRAVREASAWPTVLKCVVDRLELVTIPDEVVDWASGKNAGIPRQARAVKCASFTLEDRASN